MNLPLTGGSPTCPELLCPTSCLFPMTHTFPENSSQDLLMHFSSTTLTWQWMLLCHIHHRKSLLARSLRSTWSVHVSELSLSSFILPPSFLITLCQGTPSHPQFYCCCRHRTELSYLCGNGETPNPSSKLKASYPSVSRSYPPPNSKHVCFYAATLDLYKSYLSFRGQSL